MQFKQKKAIGLQGVADVRLLRNGVRVTFKADGDMYDVAPESWPTERQPGIYNITLSQDNAKIIGINAPGGQYITKFVGFGNRNNEIPEPKILRGGPKTWTDPKTSKTKKWMQPDTLNFFAKEIILSAGKYEGLEINYMLPYSFVPGINPSVCDVMDKPGNLEKLEAWLRFSGFDIAGDEIPYSGNILPWLEKFLLAKSDANLKLITTNERGFVDTISALPPELAGAMVPEKKAKKGKK